MIPNQSLNPSTINSNLQLITSVDRNGTSTAEDEESAVSAVHGEPSCGHVVKKVASKNAIVSCTFSVF